MLLILQFFKSGSLTIFVESILDCKSAHCTQLNLIGYFDSRLLVWIRIKVQRTTKLLENWKRVQHEVKD